MDIYCPKCAEPWDLDSLHEEVSERYPDDPYPKHVPYNSIDRRRWSARYEKRFNTVRAEFASKGCATLSYGRCNPETNANPLIGEVYDLLGDDIDGAASLLDDARYQGLI